MANRTYTVDNGSSGSQRGCGNTGQRCPAANPNAFGTDLSNSAMEEFGQGINAQSSLIHLPMREQDDSYNLPMPGGRGTRVIKRTRVTRTSTDPDDPELQNNSLFQNDADLSPKSHGSSGPDTYNSYQGYHEPSLVQQSIPPMNKRPYRKNYDDNISAPAVIGMDRGPVTPKSACFPAYPLLDSQDRTYKSNRTLPRSAYSSGYSPNSLAMASAPAAYGRSFDPARVIIDPRTDNQTAPGAINASYMSRNARSPYENRTAPATYDRSFDPARVIIDPRTDNQTAPGNLASSSLSRSGRAACGNIMCGSNINSKGSSGYDAASEYSPGASPASLYMPSRQAPRISNRVTTSPGPPASYYTSGGSPTGNSYGSKFQQFTPPQASHVSGYNDSSQIPASSPGSFNNSDFRTPRRRPNLQQTVPKSVIDSNPNYSTKESLQRSIDPIQFNRSVRNQSQPPLSRDYFSLIDDGTLSPTSKKKKIIRQTTSAGSVVSEECEEVYDIPESFGVTGSSPINPIDSFDGKNFEPMYTSSPQRSLLPCLDKSGINPARPGMPHYVGRANQQQRKGNQSSTITDSHFNSSGVSSKHSPYIVPNQSSTINDSDFSTVASSGSRGKKGPCSCKKKGGRKSPPTGHQLIVEASKCEDVGTPCKDKRSQSSNRSYNGPDIALADDPVSVFQAGRYDIPSDVNATYSGTSAADSKSCICKGGNNISLDLDRIEQEEFTQLTRNLSQWQQSRRKVVSKMDSTNISKPDSASCIAVCATPKK